MLYSLLTAVIILSFLMPLVGILCFIKGYNLNAKKIGEQPITTPHISTLKERKESKKRDEELEKFNIISQNLENYDGTAVGQQEID